MRAALLLITCSTIAYAETPKPEPPPALIKADPIPPVKGPVTSIEEKKTVTVGGTKITFAYASHKHVAAGSGPAPGMWGFEFVRGGKKAETELRHTASAFEAEVDAHGALLVFRHAGYTKFDIVLAAAKAPKPLDDDQCSELIDKAAETRKFPTGGNASTSEYNGIVQRSTPTWVGYCGTLTKRVWFTPPKLRKRE
jgi:hypothetical protein